MKGGQQLVGEKLSVAAATAASTRRIGTCPVIRLWPRCSGYNPAHFSSMLNNTGICVLDPNPTTGPQRDAYYPLTAPFEGCLQRGEPTGALNIREDLVYVGRPLERDPARRQL